MFNHPAIESLPRWRGVPQDGFIYDVIGTRTRYEFVQGLLIDKCPTYPAGVECGFDLPPLDEQYLEWIDFIEAVQRAKDEFTMIELGAGYGRWVVRASSLVRVTRNIPFKLVAVEAEPTHFRWLTDHLQDNDINLVDHELIQAAVTPTGEPVKFHVGDPGAWYGQAIAHDYERVADPAATGKDKGIVWVKGVSLNAILARHSLVDLIDLDVQGAEFDVLLSAAEELIRKVRRVHIGTHGHDIEVNLRKLFKAMGWVCLNDYRCQTTEFTLYGDIKFGDGVQTWLNPRLAVKT